MTIPKSKIAAKFRPSICNDNTQFREQDIIDYVKMMPRSDLEIFLRKVYEHSHGDTTYDFKGYDVNAAINWLFYRVGKWNQDEQVLDVEDFIFRPS